MSDQGNWSRIELSFLGSPSMRVDGRPVELPGGRVRALLAVLALAAGESLPTAELAERVWGSKPPANIGPSLHTLMTRLRRHVGPKLILTDRTGYRLRISPDRVDVIRFGRLLTEAAEATSQRAEYTKLIDALRLWRGRPFEGVESEWLDEVELPRLVEQYLAAVERRAQLAGDREYPEVIAQLRRLTVRYPLRESVWVELLRLLGRTGRTAEALELYEQVRQRIADELGVDPGPELRGVFADLLAPAESARPQRDPPSVPRQLPTALATFTGRKEELDRLTDALTGPADRPGVRIAAISGIGGVGKTSLALHWAHQNLDRYPDGQLFADLRGFDPAAEPLAAETVLAGLLEALGAATVPADPQARAGQYRTMLAGRRILLVLDNAADSAQVEPLLPGDASCAVIVTSRRRPAGLIARHGAERVDVGPLDPEDAEELLTTQLGGGRVREPAALGQLVQYCAGLPLALSIVAARAVADPRLPLVTLAGELRDTRGRLDALATDELDADLRAVLLSSYRTLDCEDARLFRLLGLAPGPDIGVAAAAALADLPPVKAGALLSRLETASLLQQHLPGRYRLHDLVRIYAAELTTETSRDSDRRALRRLADHYLHTACEADRWMAPARASIQLLPAAPGSRPQRLSGRDAAAAWTDAENDCLLAVQRLAAEQGWSELVWRLAWALLPYHLTRGRFAAQAEMWQLALATVHRLADPADQALVFRFCGRSRSLLGRHDEAFAHLETALRYAERSDDPLVVAHTHQALAAASSRQGDHARALKHAELQAELYRQVGEPKYEADALSALGHCQARVGRYEEAKVSAAAAAELYRRYGEPDGEADALDTLGYVAHQLGDYQAAQAAYQQAIALYDQLGNRDHQAVTLERLGDSLAASGNHSSARSSWLDARALYEAQQRTDKVTALRARLGAT